MTQLFNFANAFVLPFWALMILLPNWGFTKKVMESMIPFVVLASLYIYFFADAITPESFANFANPEVIDLAPLFADEKIFATGWTHFLVMDLFVGRWIYWEGQKTGLFTLHSLILCLFAGPIGLLSHIVTAGVKQKFFSKESSETLATES